MIIKSPIAKKFENFLSTLEDTRSNKKICSDISLQIFYDLFKIRTILKGNGKLQLGKKMARSFIEIIQPFIIPSMRYKITLTP